jgi:membrane-associated phospholipid phosphatase
VSALLAALLLATSAAPEPAPLALSAELEVPLLGGSAAALGFGYMLARESPGTGCPCDPARVPPFDRTALGRSSAGAAVASDVLENALIFGAPLFLSMSEWGRGFGPARDALVVEAEVLLATAAVTQIAKAAFARPRPYAYPTSDVGGDSYAAFWSGHTSVAFAAATSMVYWLHRRQPGTRWDLLAAVLGFAAAAATGVLRVVAGRHFPSDVAAGALAGTALGWAIPAIHFGEGLSLAAGDHTLAVEARF